LRKTVEIITEQINLNTRSRAKAFIGQKEGMTQKKQIETLEQFKDDKFNVLVATSVSEEGLHIENADIGIFFEPVPSALRTIQRRGRIGRINIGKVYMLITRDTIDEKYYWVSYHKERRMKELLENES
jgi:Fanconi anemia group M protein